MLKNRPKPLSELISQPDSALRRLADEARRRISLGDHMRTGLPEHLSAGVLGCNIRSDGTLVMIVSSPEWAARLRFESERLLRLCRQREPQAQRVKLRVADTDSR